MGWPFRLLNAIHVGADLSMVSSKFFHWLLVDPKDGTIRFSDHKIRPYIEDVAKFYERRLKGDEPSDREWAAWVARAEWAAWAVRAERAERAVRAERAEWAELAELAERAEWAERAVRAVRAEWAVRAERAERAEWAERAELAARAERAAHYIKMSDKLISLLEDEIPLESKHKLLVKIEKHLAKV